MRLEVTARNLEEIPSFLRIFEEFKVKAVDITNTVKDVDPVEVARLIKESMPAVDITLYFSAKFFLDSSVESARAAFRKKFEEAKKMGIKRFLLVSGHPRSSFDVLEMLHILNDLRMHSGCEILCAYNPYFDPGRLREEQERLRAKMGFGFVHGIALQVGMDTGKLQKGVEQIRTLLPDASLYGSVPAPAQGTLDQLKENALYGVFLPNSYLLNTEMATEMTVNLLGVFKDLQIEPIIFAPNAESLREAMPLLKK